MEQFGAVFDLGLFRLDRDNTAQTHYFIRNSGVMPRVTPRVTNFYLTLKMVSILTEIGTMAKKSAIHIALLKEMKSYLENSGFQVLEEIVFSKIMPTKRKYRADYCVLKEKVIIEINGGQFVNGRHNRAGKVKGSKCTQYENDLNKINLAQKNGWKVFQFTYQQLARREYLDYL